MVPKIKLIVISERSFYFGITFSSFMELCQDPGLTSMEEVHKPETIRDKSQLDYEFNVKWHKLH